MCSLHVCVRSQAGVLIPQTGGDAARRRRGRPGPAEYRCAAGQRRHRHAVRRHARHDASHCPSTLALTSAALLLPSCRLRLARMNEEMRESEGPFGQPGQYPASSPTEQQYKKCIQEFICLNITEC